MGISEITLVQLAIIGEIREALAAANVRWWLFGGWGLDARIGRLTRHHHDIEFWVYREDAEVTREALAGLGFAAKTTQPPEESQEFEKDGVRLSSAFLYQEDAGPPACAGRWSDWRFPPNSFDSPPAASAISRCPE